MGDIAELAPGFGGSSLIELAATGDAASVLSAVRCMFDVEDIIR